MTSAEAQTFRHYQRKTHHNINQENAPRSDSEKRRTSNQTTTSSGLSSSSSSSSSKMSTGSSSHAAGRTTTATLTTTTNTTYANKQRDLYGAGHYYDEPSDFLASSSSGYSDKAQTIGNDQQPMIEPSESTADPNKQHHVGPVMGIFFKVWSLVKVTKMRSNHNKMRRQNSEDASQFQYISGDQLTLAQQRQQRRSTALLEDRNFRRAGSQPVSSGRLAIDLPALGETAANGQRLQPVHQASTPPSTSSTSTSGVSSATTNSGPASASSSSSSPPPPPPIQTGVPATAKRHVSAYSLRKSIIGESMPTVAQRVAPVPAQCDRIKSKAMGMGSSASNWAAKIKRSATTVNQSDLSTYVSRYRHFKRDSRPFARLALAVGGGSCEEHQSEPTVSDRDEEIEEEEEEEEDSNDIYSTPNDSIQSVPSTAQVIFSNQDGQLGSLQQQHVDHQPISAQCRSHHQPSIVKSLSTSNFSQLASSACQHTSGPTSERRLKGGDFRVPSIEEQEAANQVDLIRHDSIKSGGSSSRLNGSRFFISSSSSEDSNQANLNLNSNQQQQQPARPHNKPARSKAQQQQVNQQQSTTIQLERPQLPIQHGVHYHAPVSPTRPDILLLSDLQPAQSNFVMSLFTPTAINSQPVVGNQRQQQQHSPTLDTCSPHPLAAPTRTYLKSCAYKKSPSLFEISQHQHPRANRYFTKYPSQQSSFKPATASPAAPMAPSNLQINNQQQRGSISGASAAAGHNHHHVPNSVSLHDCKLSTRTGALIDSRHAGKQLPAWCRSPSSPTPPPPSEESSMSSSEYKLAQLLLEFSSNPNGKDANGYTALMHAVLSDNLPAIRCLVEHGANLNDANHDGLTALDLICSKAATPGRLEILKLLIDNKADLDRARESDGTRLLDRLISEHKQQHSVRDDKLPFIDCLLQNGAKLGSSTWLAATDKHEIQLRLLKKLCQDGYFLYKKCSIEAAVYRFEYALKRIAELEHQLVKFNCRHSMAGFQHLEPFDYLMPIAVQQIKYQTYLGLSRCERKRRFYKRALEFAHMAILVDSTSYEGYYSKAHILKDVGEIDDSLLAIDQTFRLVEKSIESIRIELKNLQQHEEALIFDGCFNVLDAERPAWLEASRAELNNNLDYLKEAQKHILRLKSEIMDDKLKNNLVVTSASPVNSDNNNNSSNNNNGISNSYSATSNPIAI